MSLIYLDNAATTMIKPPAVASAVQKAMKTMASPGRGGYTQAMKAADVVFDCRSRAASLFNVDDPERIVLTMNATHGLNIAIKTLIQKGDRVVVSGYEHNAVTRPLTAVGAETIVAKSRLFDRSDALAAFKKAIDYNTKAVVCTHVSNVFGFELPIYEIAELCKKKRLPLIIDASQSAGSHGIDQKLLDAAFIAMPGHKGLYGPQGTGILICGVSPKTLIEGGTGSDSKSYEMPAFLPDRLEAGTHNVPGIAGLNEGLKFVENNTASAILQKEKSMVAYLVKGLRKNDKIQVFTANEPQSGVLSMRFNGLDCESAAEKLSRHGIAVRAGLHCAPLAHSTVGTLETGTVRASVSAMTTKRELDSFLAIVNNF